MNSSSRGDMHIDKPAIAVARGASYFITNNVLNSIASVLAFAFIARLISRTEMGGLTVLVVVVALTLLISGVGISSTATRFVALFGGAGETEKMRKVSFECLIVNGVATFAIAALVYFLAPWLSIFALGAANRAIWFQLLALEITAVGLNSSFASILTGLKKFKELAATNIATFAIRQTLVVVLLFLGWGVPGVIIGWSAGDLLATAIYATYTLKFLGRPITGFGIRKLLKFSWPLFFGDVASYIWTYFDRVLLIPLVTLAQLGAYNVATTAYSMLNSFPLAVAGVLFPFYADFYGSDISGTASLQNAIERASRYISLLTIPLCIGLAAIAYPAVILFAGSGYADAAVPLIVLSVFLAVACQVRAIGQIFVVLGKPLTAGSVTILSVAVPILVGVLTIPVLGIVGAAAARGLSLLVSLVISIAILRTYFNVRLDMRAYASAWVASLIMAAVLLIPQQITGSSRLVPVYILVGGLIFLLALRPLKVINSDDLDLVSDFLGKRFSLLTRILGKILLTKSGAQAKR